MAWFFFSVFFCSLSFGFRDMVRGEFYLLLLVFLGWSFLFVGAFSAFFSFFS